MYDFDPCLHLFPGGRGTVPPPPFPMYAQEFVDYQESTYHFITQSLFSLIKDMNSRPKFSELMEDPFFKHYNAQGEAFVEQRASFGGYVARFLPIE